MFAVADGIVYADQDNPTRVSAFDWETGTYGDFLGSPVIANGIVYMGSRSGLVYALHLPDSARARFAGWPDHIGARGLGTVCWMASMGEARQRAREDKTIKIEIGLLPGQAELKSLLYSVVGTLPKTPRCEM